MPRRDFEPRHDLAIYFDTIVSASTVFGPFLRGCNISNPVKDANKTFKDKDSDILIRMISDELVLVYKKNCLVIPKYLLYLCKIRYCNGTTIF